MATPIAPETIEARIVSMASSSVLAETIKLEVDDAHHHASTRIERQILEAERSVEGAEAIIERMGHHAEATDVLREATMVVSAKTISERA